LPWAYDPLSSSLPLQDYLCSRNIGSKEGQGGHNIKEYYVSLDMGKIKKQAKTDLVEVFAKDEQFWTN